MLFRMYKDKQVMVSCDRASWIMKRWRKNQLDAEKLKFLLVLLTQYVSDIIMPIIRSTKQADKPYMEFSTDRAIVDLSRRGRSRVHLVVMVTRPFVIKWRPKKQQN
jgi:hypothetical protein